jgi:transglutaminase-like putative cysteine protease
MSILLVSRLILYYLVISLPVIHPGVVVSYDFTGWCLWFVIVPGEMLIAYFLSPPKFKVRTWLLSAVVPLVLSLIFITGFSAIWLLFAASAVFAFVSTAFIFKGEGRGRSVVSLELFILAVIAYKMLSFSRSSEEIARESSGIAQGILIFTVCAFLIHSLILYFAAYRGRITRDNRRELIVFAGVAVPAAILIALLLPPNFVSHSIVFNRLSDPPEPDIIPLDEYGDGRSGGSLRSDKYPGEREGGKDGQNGQGGEKGNGRAGRNMLEGVPADQWGEQGTGRGNEGRQYAVMIVASPVDPVYAAEAYYDRFNEERGFQIARDEPLNELTFQRFLDTWKNRDIHDDQRRKPTEMFFLSTIPDRVLAYEPRAVEPTVFNTVFHPFDYSYTAVSAVSMTDVKQWRSLRNLTEAEKNEFAFYLQIPLSDDHRSLFMDYLDEYVKDKTDYFGRIEAILKSFSTYQYEVGFDDDVSTAKMADFLFQIKSGDCTEFSNASAILARIAGIPTRVVTGYLSSKGLQTPAHRRGVRALREAIEPLKEIPEDQLNLVTNAHRHSWVQFYLPDYGWVDFETTAFAIPPVGAGDPNNMNVVIPLIQQAPQPAPVFQFPWLLAIKLLGVLLIALLMALYVFRYARGLYLKVRAGGSDRVALRALYRMLLIQLAEEGYRIKEPSQTAMEYTRDYKHLSTFSEQYTSLRYRVKYGSGERERSWGKIRESYREAITRSRRKGFWNALKRFFTLRGLFY